MRPVAIWYIQRSLKLEWTRSSAGLERHTTDVEVTGSNPVESAIFNSCRISLLFLLFYFYILGKGGSVRRKRLAVLIAILGSVFLARTKFDTFTLAHRSSCLRVFIDCSRARRQL